MKLESLALILLVCVSMPLVAQTRPPSTVRANDGRIRAVHALTGDIGTGKSVLCRTVRPFSATTFTALISKPLSWVKELLRELLLRYGVAFKDTVRSLIDASSSITALTERVAVFATIPQQHRPTQMSSACKGFPTS